MIIDRPTPATRNGLGNVIRGWPRWNGCFVKLSRSISFVPPEVYIMYIVVYISCIEVYIYIRILYTYIIYLYRNIRDHIICPSSNIVFSLYIIHIYYYIYNICIYIHTFANTGHYIFAKVAMAAPVQHAMAGAVAPALHYWPGAAVPRHFLVS